MSEAESLEFAGHKGGECTCQVCGLNFDVELPDQLVEAAHHHDLVIFAGAGISTETSRAYPRTIYNLAGQLLGVDGERDESFPSMMGRFEEKFGRAELVRMVSRKLELVDTFDVSRDAATEFHRELATMPYLRDIVTTNWDQYFERYCGATPFVTGQDVGLWETATRRVLKIHGSLGNPGSLVATQTDYERCLERLSGDTIGAFLRNLLATKTIVYIGYSLTDWNFLQLHKTLMEDVRSFAPRSYLVTPFADGERHPLGMEILKTSGTQFLRQLKSRLVGHCFIGDEAFEAVRQFELEVLDFAELTLSPPHSKYPAVYVPWAYLDGVRDICSRIRHRRRFGEFSDRHYVQSLFRQYSDASDQAWDEERFGDFAYFEACVNCLLLLLEDDWGHEHMRDENDAFDRQPMLSVTPRFLVIGASNDLLTEEDFREAMLQSRRRAPKVRKHGREVLADLPDDMTLRSDPFRRAYHVEGSKLARR